MTRRDSGFAIIDMMITMVMAAIGLAGIYMLSIEGTRTRRVDAETNQALQACRQQIETVRNTSFSALPGLNNTGFAVDTNADSIPELNAVPGDPDSLPGLLTITVDQTTGGETLYRVIASVVWSGVSGPRSLWLETLVANRSGQ